MRRLPSAHRLTVAGLLLVLGLTGVNVARYDWMLVLDGLLLASGLAQLLVTLSYIENR